MYTPRPHGGAVRDLVAAADLLIGATSDGREDGEVWSAVRDAASAGKPVVVVGPAGQVLAASPELGGGPAQPHG